MNGAGSLLRSLIDNDVDVCFSNPGTSEMHFVAALDDVPEMRGILALFEGVATGAADGYGRVTGKPAGVLLHLGPGLGNGLANLHNARRARTPVVTIVGDHATTHARYDAPLQSDIVSVAGTLSTFLRVSASPNDVGADAADAVAGAMGPPSGVATLILPADVSWGEVSSPSRPTTHHVARAVVDPDNVRAAAHALRAARRPALLIGGSAVASEEALDDAARIADISGAILMMETFPSIAARGAGTPQISRLGYLAEFAAAQLDGVDLILTVDAAAPASFFAYPAFESNLVPEGADVMAFAGPSQDVPRSLAALADELGAAAAPVAPVLSSRPDRPQGRLTSEALGAAIGGAITEGMVVVDESNTGGIHVAGATAGAPRHDWLTLTGGAIGYGLPAAVGAAVGRPEVRILCLESDGSAMYTLQALWTMARESLNVTVVLLSNRSYAILNLELARVGAVAEGSAAASMLDLTGPELDFVSLAKGMGVPASRAETADELVKALEAASTAEGPVLIEAMLPAGLS